MKVRELIATLQAAVANNPEAADMDVSTEGCDCYGGVGKVVVEDPVVVLYRP